jgi:hypothetical protein
MEPMLEPILAGFSKTDILVLPCFASDAGRPFFGAGLG